MSYFFAGGTFRHQTSQDLDIYVVKVRYADAKRVKLLIWWRNKRTGQRVQIKDKITDNVTITADQFQYWSVVKDIEVHR